MKLGKKAKFVIYALNDKKTEIVVKETSADADYDSFLEALPENDCRYAVYDFEYELSNGEGKRSKIVFYTWSPDTAPVRVSILISGFLSLLTNSPRWFTPPPRTLYVVH